MLCQSKNVYPYENIQNSLINDSKAKNNENEELQIFQQERYYDKLNGKMMQIKKNQQLKLMSNEEILQEKARRQSMKNPLFSTHYDNLINKNVGFRYRNNSLTQQLSLQHYMNTQTYNDILLYQQQQQFQQLSSPDIPFQLYQLQNNMVNYHSNPSLLFQSMKDPFFGNHRYSQAQESIYSPINLSSQAQRPVMSSSHQCSSQYSQQMQNLYNNNVFNNNNDNISNKVIKNNNEDIKNAAKENKNLLEFEENVNSKKNNNINELNDLNKNKIINNKMKEDVDSISKKESKDLINRNENSKELKLKNKNNKNINETTNNNEEVKQIIKNNSIINNDEKNVDIEIDHIKNNKDEEKINDNNNNTNNNNTNNNNTDNDHNTSTNNNNNNNNNNNKTESDNESEKATFFNFIASPPFNNNKNLENSINNNFSKTIQLHSPQSQSPIPKVKICKHIPLQLQSPQSQSQTPQQMKSPTFIIPSKKDSILTSPTEEPKLTLVSPSTNDIKKFIKIKEKLKETIEIKNNKLNSSSNIPENQIKQNNNNKNISISVNNDSSQKIIDNHENKENINENNNINSVKLLNEHPLVFSEIPENKSKDEEKLDVFDSNNNNNNNNNNNKEKNNSNIIKKEKEIPILNDEDKLISFVEKNKTLEIIPNKHEIINDDGKNESQNNNLNTSEYNESKIELKNKLINNDVKEHPSNEMDINLSNDDENKNISKKIQKNNQMEIVEEPNDLVNKSIKSVDSTKESIPPDDSSNLPQAQPNDDMTSMNPKSNYQKPDYIKNNYHTYPPRVNVLNQKFQRYLQQRQYMKLRNSYDNMQINYSFQKNPLYFNSKFYNHKIPQGVNQMMHPYNYYPMQNNNTMPPYPFPSKMIRPINYNYMYYHNRPSYHPYSYPFMNFQNNNYYNHMIYHGNRRFEYNNIPNSNTMNYNNIPQVNPSSSVLSKTTSSTPSSTPIKIPPLSAFFKKDSSISHYISRTLNNPINKKQCKLKMKSTIDKTTKTSWLNKKRYFDDLSNFDGITYGSFSLRYLNFFLLRKKQENENIRGFEDYISLAELIIPNDINRTIDITSISEKKIPTYQDIFDKYIQTTSFIALKINFFVPNQFNENIFMNTLIFETNVFRRIKCTTTVYSFGKKILETEEICNTSLKENKYILNFEFVNKFFTEFLSKFDEFKTYEEMQFALENLSIIQQFNDLTVFNEEPRKWLVIGYQFGIGNGKIDIAKSINFIKGPLLSFENDDTSSEEKNNETIKTNSNDIASLYRKVISSTSTAKTESDDIRNPLTFYINRQMKKEKRKKTKAKKNDEQAITKNIEKSKLDVPISNESFYCEICKMTVNVPKINHIHGIPHILSNKKMENNNNQAEFHLKGDNVGYQLLVKQGWDEQSGLGSKEDGRLYPVRVNYKHDKTGIGIKGKTTKNYKFKDDKLLAESKADELYNKLNNEDKYSTLLISNGQNSYKKDTISKEEYSILSNINYEFKNSLPNPSPTVSQLRKHQKMVETLELAKKKGLN
eukprot:jgi/Orpsp1_1/1183344/evm.model.c7180000084790.1